VWVNGECTERVEFQCRPRAILSTGTTAEREARLGGAPVVAANLHDSQELHRFPCAKKGA
jgi:hypothetical protein